MEKLLIPEQQIGSKLDISSSETFNTVEDAIAFFEIVKTRLLNVNQWDNICQLPSSVFKLFNHSGQEIKCLVEVGNYIQINIPGPGTILGCGYDWVKVEEIEKMTLSEGALLSMTVRPTHHPLKPTKETAHFYNSQSTSTFQVKQIQNKIYAEIHGRNELPNNKTNIIFDNVRNTLIGWGAKLGFSYPQWHGLAKGLVKF